MDELSAAQQNHDAVHVILPYEKKGEFYIEPLGDIGKKPVYDFLKRFFDIFLSIGALAVLAIPMAVIALIIKKSSPGPVLYRQDRLGKDGVRFELLKFRTMRTDAEANGAQWSEGENDPRIVPQLAFIRRCRADETVQFWQCITGKMSLVGPRPERECFYDEFETYIHGFHERLKVKPGITGLAQVNGGYDLRPEEKIAWDVEYIKRRSLWLDFKILCKTVKVLLTGAGAK